MAKYSNHEDYKWVMDFLEKLNKVYTYGKNKLDLSANTPAIQGSASFSAVWT